VIARQAAVAVPRLPMAAAQGLVRVAAIWAE
jgi:hypothetical protein